MMKKIIFQTTLLPAILATASIFAACGNEPAANHEAALPHNKMNEAQELSEAETKKLMEAEGKSARLITLADFEKLVLEDTASLTAVNFWKNDCEICIASQLHLQRIQQEQGTGKLTILSVNLEPATATDQVNLTLRTAGFTTKVFQLPATDDLRNSGMVLDWNGNLPALALFSDAEFITIFQQEFSENELRAVLQPFLL